MGYPDGEAALLALIKAHAGYDGRNASRQDWKVLKSGASDHYAVLRPGPYTNADNGFGLALRTWRTVIECWRPYRNDEKPQDLQTDVMVLIEYLETYPRINSTAGVYEANITGGGDMVEVTLENGSLWARWDIYYDWQEEKVISYAE